MRYWSDVTPGPVDGAGVILSDCDHTNNNESGDVKFRSAICWRLLRFGRQPWHLRR